MKKNLFKDGEHIAFMGPIGVGKSSLTASLSSYLEYDLMEEPVAENKFLDLFYQDPETFALLSQNAFYSELFYLMWNCKDEENVLYDSSLISNLVFTELMRLEGIMDAIDVALTYSIANKHLDVLGHVDAYVCFLRPKERLFEQMIKRDRNCETGGEELSEEDKLKKVTEDEYFNFHYDNYEDTVRRLAKSYKIEHKMIYVDLGKTSYIKRPDALIKAIRKAAEEQGVKI